MEIDTKEWLGMQEAADHAGVTRATIHNWHKKGLIKAVALFGRKKPLVYSKDDIDNHIKTIKN